MEKSDEDMVKAAQAVADNAISCAHTLGVYAERVDSAEARNAIRELLESMAAEACHAGDLI